MPVVSSTSPPESHGVGSGSSEMCTQRTGASAWASPASTGKPRSPTSPRTVSTTEELLAGVQHPLRRLLQDGAQDRLDLLEVGGTRDERGRQLDDRVAAVVGAADEP